MKRLWISMAVALLAIALSLCIFGFLLPPQYDETFLGELQAKRDLLAAPSDRPRIILLGGSGVAFGVDSSLIEESLPDYRVVNYGLYAALGTRVMLDLSAEDLREGDIVIVMPEQQRQTLSDYLGADVMWQAADGHYDALLALHTRDVGEMLAAYPVFAMSKLRYWLKGKPETEGIYRRSSFNEDGDIVSDLCAANVMAGGYDPTTMIEWDRDLLTDEFCDALNAYTKEAVRRGVEVWYHYAPMNAAAMVIPEDEGTAMAGSMENTDIHAAETTGTEDDAGEETRSRMSSVIDAYAASLQDRIDAPLAGDPKDCVMESGWFYDTNYHLNSSGKVVYTRQLIRDIKAMLGDSSPTEITMPEMPALQYVAETAADSSDAAYFLYEQRADGAVLTGLTEDGRMQTALTVPGEIGGLPVTAIEASALHGADRLTDIVIQENITALPDDLFAGCRSLREIVLQQEDPARLLVGQQLLKGVPETCRIMVPAVAYTEYCLSYSWAAYANRITPSEE